MAPLEMPLQPNTVGTKLHHPGLSTREVLTAVGLAAAAYADTRAQLDETKQEFIDLTPRLVGNGVVLVPDLWSWTPITAELDLQKDLLVAADGETDPILFRNTEYGGEGTPEAIVLKRGTSDIAIAFRGTNEEGDQSDWGRGGEVANRRHYEAFEPLLTAIGQYLDANPAVQRVTVAGHSLGGAMVEFFMEDHPDGSLYGIDGNTTHNIEYEAVALASPQASLNNDPRILNIGHESDIVYGVWGFRTTLPLGERTNAGNAVAELHLVVDTPWQLIEHRDTENQHSIGVSYPHSVQTLFQSQFYEHSTRVSRVIINLAGADNGDPSEEAAEEWLWDGPAIVLGRDGAITLEDGTVLNENDFLVGGADDDFLEGFRGNDILQGDHLLRGEGGADTLAGGIGRDEFRGRPNQINNDTITDLEVGDRIRLIRENLVQSDVTQLPNEIRIATDDSIFDWGDEITIFADIPTMSTLVVGDSPDPALADGAGAYIHVVFDGPAVGERPEERVIDIADSQWNVRGHHPNGIITYTGTTLTITEQESAGEQIRVEGYFDWVQNIGGSAREIVEGYIDTGNDNYIRLEGKELQNVSEPDDTDEWDFFWQLGEYVGFVEDNGTDIVGYWNYVRDAWHAFRVEEPPDLALGLGESVSVGSLLPETAADGSAVELWKVWDYDAASLSGYFFGKGYGEDGTFIDEGRFPGREQIRVASEHVEELEFGWVSEVGPKQFAAAPWEGEEWGSWEVFDVLVA